MMDLERALTLFAVTGEQNLESMLAQRGGEHPAQRHVVIDHQHPLAINVTDALFSDWILRVDFVHEEPNSSRRLRPTCRRLAKIRTGPNRPSCSRAPVECALLRPASRTERTS